MDVTRGAYVVSASLKGVRKAGTVRRAVTGERPLERLFTAVALSRPGPPGRAVDQGHPQNVLEVYAGAVKFVQGHGLSATGHQEPKTRKALEFFARTHPSR